MKWKLLLLAGFFILNFAFIGCADKNKERPGDPRVLLFTKTAGFRHASIPDGVKAIQKMGLKEGFVVDTTSISAKFTEDTLKQYAAVIFLSTTGDILNYREQLEFQRYIQAGGGYVGVHGAVDSEYDWPWYEKLIGAYFKNHPAIQEAQLNIHADENFKITDSLPNPWVRTDEWYNFISLPNDVQVLVSIDEASYEGGENGENHPMVWYHEYDGGRAFYTALGHTSESYEEPYVLDLLKAGIKYAIGKNEILNYENSHTLRVPEENRFSKEILGDGLDEPTELTVLPDLGILVAERKGNIKYYNPADSSLTVVATLEVYDKALEAKNVNVEFGVLGMKADPNYKENNWIYVYYSPVGVSVDRLSRFKFINGTFESDSEQVILEVETDREICCHTGGSIAFDSKGYLYLSTGDNSTPFDQIDPATGKAFFYNIHGYAPLDDRPGYTNYDARRSSGNSNDLRGKILRIQIQEDGSYTIPQGNLFSEGTSETRPEIFVMGTRNPYRISVDPKADHLYWGDVGPDANNDSLSTRGPRGYDEINQATKAGNYGWPYFVGKNHSYREYNYETGQPGVAFDPEGPRNSSLNNTGIADLPSAIPAFIEYPYTVSSEYPILGKGGRTAMAGPVYNVEAYPEETRLPDYYDGKLFIYDWVRDWIMAVSMDNDKKLQTIEPFMENTSFQAISDMEVGPDGRLYTVEYGKGWYSKNPGATLSALTYNRGNRPPVVEFSLDKEAGALPLKVRASAEGTFDPDGDALTYVWQFDNGVTEETSVPYFEHSLDEEGIFALSLEVRDGNGAISKAPAVQVFAGNSRPEVAIDILGNSTFYFPNRPVEYRVNVTDPEDGEIEQEDLKERGYVKADYLESTDQAALHSADLEDMTTDLPGKTKMEALDCMACHKTNEKSIGPSYKEMAARYKNDMEAINFLPQTILKGGSGNWGDMAMAAHPDLPLSDAKEIVAWILSLANEEDSEQSLPMEGSFIPSDRFQLSPNGDIVLSASYADKGTERIQPLTGIKKLVLLNPSLKMETAQSSPDVAAMQVGGRQMKFITQDNSWIKYSNISLKDVRSVEVSYGMGETTEKGWKLEIRLSTPEGKLIGEKIIGVGAKEREPMKAILPLTRDFEESALQEVYFVFLKIDTKEQAGLGVRELKLLDR